MEMVDGEFFEGEGLNGGEGDTTLVAGTSLLDAEEGLDADGGLPDEGLDADGGRDGDCLLIVSIFISKVFI